MRSSSSVFPSAWTAVDVARDRSWEFVLTPAQRADLAALAGSIEPAPDPTAPPPAVSMPAGIVPVLQAVLAQVRDGFGFALIKGFPVDGSEACLGSLLFSMGAALGTPIRQNRYGERIVPVKDRSGDGHKSRGYASRIALPLHSDTSDIIVLACIRPAVAGGETAVVSSLSIHERLVATAPHLLDPLYRGYSYQYPESPDVPTGPVPVFSKTGDKVSCRYLRAFIDRAEPDMDGPRREALDRFHSIANDPDLLLRFHLEPGDVLLVNNYTALHARTEFEDSDDPQTHRLLLRLWLNVPDFRPLHPLLEEQARRFDR